MSCVYGLVALYDGCAALKWHHLILGDDYETQAKYCELSVLADELGEAGRNLFEDFKAHHCSGPAYGTERVPLPERPSIPTLF